MYAVAVTYVRLSLAHTDTEKSDVCSCDYISLCAAVMWCSV